MTLLVVENGVLGVNKDQDPSSNLSFRNYFKISPNKVSGFFHLIPNQFAGSCFYLDHFTNGNLKQYIDLCNRDANNQCSHHIGTSQLICRANQLTGFYMMGTLVVKGLNTGPSQTPMTEFSWVSFYFLAIYYFCNKFHHRRLTRSY